MKNRLSLLFALLIGLSLAFILQAGEVSQKGARIGQWTQDYSAALALAKEKNLPVFLNFTGSDWCSWCQLMDRRVFSQPQWDAFAAEKMVLVTLDFPRNQALVPADFAERNRRLQGEFGVQGYPTYIILDADGQTVLGQLGASKEATAEDFIDQVESVIRFSEGEIAKKLKSLSPEDAQRYSALLASFQNTQGELMSWLNTQPQRTPENEAKFKNFVDRLEAMEMQLDGF